MRLLLDTHTLLWWQTDPTKLSKAALQIIKNAESNIFLSVVNSWEMQIKVQLGKLTLPRTLPDLMQRQLDHNGFELLHIISEHIYELDAMPLHHKDPFDRLLIAQARHEGLTLLTHDPKFKKYNVDLYW